MVYNFQNFFRSAECTNVSDVSTLRGLRNDAWFIRIDTILDESPEKEAQMSQISRDFQPQRIPCASFKVRGGKTISLSRTDCRIIPRKAGTAKRRIDVVQPSCCGKIILSEGGRRPSTPSFKHCLAEDLMRLDLSRVELRVKADEKRVLDIKEKRHEQNQSNRNEIFQDSRISYTLSDRKRNEEILEQLEVELVEEKNQQIEIKLARS
ncbi:hypothetical protein ANN_22103 [Periplaneta americana]|uniref:Uncharacterized protein n=1 Tax=Periplaneta americana TaxID=6978 RepID=A0ABQ8S774_PERAM|nr:hypothetical protein ANN_22103 [Periplaneta americana]